MIKPLRPLASRSAFTTSGYGCLPQLQHSHQYWYLDGVIRRMSSCFDPTAPAKGSGQTVVSYDIQLVTENDQRKLEVDI
jgi:hypothetical protein